MPGPYQVAIEGRYTVTVSIGEAEATTDVAGCSINARTENRPMWFACQTAVNDPFAATVACTVGAHDQLVSRPRRSISTVSPASLEGAIPLNRSCLRSIPDARVANVIPSAVAATDTSPGSTVPLWLAGAVAGVIDAPPEPAQPSAGIASQLPNNTSTAYALARRFPIGPIHFVRRCLRGELTGSRLVALRSFAGPIRPRGPKPASGSPADRPRTDDRSADGAQYTHSGDAPSAPQPMRPVLLSVRRLGARQARQGAAECSGADREPDLCELGRRLNGGPQYLRAARPRTAPAGDGGLALRLCADTLCADTLCADTLGFRGSGPCVRGRAGPWGGRALGASAVRAPPRQRSEDFCGRLVAHRVGHDRAPGPEAPGRAFGVQFGGALDGAFGLAFRGAFGR